MKKIVKEFWQTEDGMTFETEQEAFEHENLKCIIAWDEEKEELDLADYWDDELFDVGNLFNDAEYVWIPNKEAANWLNNDIGETLFLPGLNMYDRIDWKWRHVGTWLGNLEEQMNSLFKIQDYFQPMIVERKEEMGMM